MLAAAALLLGGVAAATGDCLSGCVAVAFGLGLVPVTTVGPAERTVTKRGKISVGTFTRANTVSPPAGSRTSTARLSDRFEM